MAETDPVADLRRRLRALRLAPPPRALSVDGRTFEYEVPVDRAVPLGAFVRLTVEDGGSFLGHVLSRELAVRQGPTLSIDRQELRDRFPGVPLGDATVAVEVRVVHGDGVLLRSLDPDEDRPLGDEDVFEDAEVEVAEGAIVEAYLRGLDPGTVLLEVGRVTTGGWAVPALLRAAGFNRHTFLCGQSGSGKTFALGVLLERLLLSTSLPLVVIDPNGDFVRLGEAPDPEGLSAEGAQDAELLGRYAEVAAGVRVLRARPGEGGEALGVRFRDLGLQGQAAALQLQPLRDREEYSDFIYLIGERPAEGWPSFEEPLRILAESAPQRAELLRTRMQNLGIPQLDVWSREPSVIQVLEESPRALVLDVSGYEVSVERSAVALATFRHLWDRREGRRPTLIVIDEAHNVCPAEPEDELQALVVQELVRIAGEGRKYGLHLLLTTQRPAKVHPNVLSQCDNLVLMRMNSAADLAHVAETFSFAPAPLVGLAARFRLGEALIAGTIAPSPLLLAFGGRLSPEGGGDVPTTWAALNER